MRILPLLTIFTFLFLSYLHAEKPNVILITIDDLNDWIEPLGGHPNARTPEITKFANTGAVVFRNAVCPAPVCGPSRSSFLSGFMPHNSGVYDNATNMRDSPLIQQNPTLPEFFSQRGYFTLSTGKIFHSHQTAHGSDYGHWAFDKYWYDPLWDNEDKSKTTNSEQNLIDGSVPDPVRYQKWEKTKGLAWGPTREPAFEKTKDYSKVAWARRHLDGSEKLKQPFFMAIGVYKPHIPWFVPQEFFDMHPLDQIEVPHINKNDLNDIKKPNGKNVHSPSFDYEWSSAYGLEQKATRAYLAASSEADRSLGVLLDGLASSSYASNTIVIIMGDHGWHLGEKLRYHKQTLWAEAVKVPLIVRTPETMKTFDEMVYCNNPVNLVDVYPTLIELCQLGTKSNLDGTSFAAMLTDPAQETGNIALTVSSKGASALSTRWHYIENRSRDFTEIFGEEFYDLKNDPYEETNLAGSTDPEIVTAMDKLRQHVPKIYHPSVQKDHPKGPKKKLDDTIKATRVNLDFGNPS